MSTWAEYDEWIMSADKWEADAARVQGNYAERYPTDYSGIADAGQPERDRAARCRANAKSIADAIGHGSTAA